MQRIVLKKEIKAKYPIEGISLVNLEDEIDYKRNNEGIYATGVIKLSGEYYKGIRNTRFNEEIDVDIFAPFDDLVSRNELRINIVDFEYNINEDIIMFSVIIDILGLKEVKKTFHSTDFQEETMVEERSGNDNSELIDLNIDNSVEVETNVSSLPEKQIKEIEVKETKKTISKETYVSWSFYVALEGDNYESISNELNLNIDELKSLNKHKEISVGTLLLIPR